MNAIATTGHNNPTADNDNSLQARQPPAGVAVNDFYVYAWRRPDTDAVFYIGKGRGRRAKEPKRNPFFTNVVAKLNRIGLEPTIEYLHTGLSEVDAFRLERAEIAACGRREFGGTLVNLTDGGEGGAGLVIGLETRTKMSQAHKGRTHTPDARAKMSAAGLGRKHSQETRAKLSAATRNRTSETLAKLSATMAGRTHAPETRSRMSSSQRMAPPRGDFKGISFDKKRCKWSAQIKASGKTSHLGRFLTPEAAARAYDKAAFKAYGAECYLNFPSEIAESADRVAC